MLTKKYLWFGERHNDHAKQSINLQWDCKWQPLTVSSMTTALKNLHHLNLQIYTFVTTSALCTADIMQQKSWHSSRFPHVVSSYSTPSLSSPCKPMAKWDVDLYGLPCAELTNRSFSPIIQVQASLQRCLQQCPPVPFLCWRCIDAFSSLHPLLNVPFSKLTIATSDSLPPSLSTSNQSNLHLSLLLTTLLPVPTQLYTRTNNNATTTLQTCLPCKGSGRKGSGRRGRAM